MFHYDITLILFVLMYFKIVSNVNCWKQNAPDQEISNYTSWVLNTKVPTENTNWMKDSSDVFM